MIRKDDRTPEQMKTHPILVVGTDKCLSGWGDACGGASVAAWACRPEHWPAVMEWVRWRSDMKRVRTAVDDGDRKHYRPKCAHLHIYRVDETHQALVGGVE